MYQIAYTRGWFTDTESLRRKDILGIEYNQDKAPKNFYDNSTSVALFQEILEAGDSSYAEINAKAAYRLSGYTLKGKDFNSSEYIAAKWMMSAYEWAYVAGNQDIMDIAMEWVKGLKKYYSDNNEHEDLQLQIEEWLSEQDEKSNEKI